MAAGGTADIVSHLACNELAKSLGQPFVVENMAGAGGTIATTEKARAAPDGYAIGFAAQGTLVFNQALYSKPGYDSLKDLTPIGLTGGVSNVMVVPPTSGAREPRLVIDGARAKPGALNHGGQRSTGSRATHRRLCAVIGAPGEKIHPLRLADRSAFRLSDRA